MECECWSDHEFEGKKFLESGRHPTMGNYHRYLVTCTRCGRETIMTEWFAMSEQINPVERLRSEA